MVLQTSGGFWLNTCRQVLGFIPKIRCPMRRCGCWPLNSRVNSSTDRLHQELPYRLTVETDKWTESKDGSVRIEQTILVERESQRKIVVGSNGQTIRAIGTDARQAIAGIINAPVHLFLFVKVREKWAEDPGRYREMGLDFPFGR